MELSPEIARLGLKPRSILYFINDEMVGTEEPHYHVVVCEVQGVLILVACTTKFDTCRRYIEYNGYPTTTLVTVQPTQGNGLRRESHLNCNQWFEREPALMAAGIVDRSVEIRGDMDERYYVQIVQGLCDSPLVDEVIKDAMRHHLS
jgi:hypothetical protein